MKSNDEIYRKTVQEFKEMAEILVDTPDIPPELLYQQLELNRAKKTIEQLEKLKVIGLQKRLMDAYYSDPLPKPKLSLIERFHALSKPAKAGLVFMVFWTVYVIYRTSSYHYLMGRELERWDDGDLLMDWLALPIIITAIYFSIRWVMTDRNAQKPVKPHSVEEQLDREMAKWPNEQRELSLQLIGRVFEQDHKSVFELVPKIEPAYFDRLVEFLFVMKKSQLKK